MAKRFTSTEKWSDPWYRKLSPKHKCLWDWLFTQCDIAGTIDPDLELASFQIGETVTKEDLKPFEERIAVLKGGRLLLTKFIEFQYGTLTLECRAHKPVFALVDRLSIPYQYTTNRHKDKDKDKNKDKKEVIQELVSEILSYLNDKLKTNYRSDTGGFISGRIADGYTIDDFKKVIDKKYQQWIEDDKMRKYIRPETLFSPGHFQQYLNEIETSPIKSKPEYVPGPLPGTVQAVYGVAND